MALYNNITTRKHIAKVWGSEEVVINNDRYCGKLLRPLMGYQSSLHMHWNKDECFYCIQGKVLLEVHENNERHDYILNGLTGDSYNLLPGTWHRFSALEPNSIIIEFSSPHSDSDVKRLEESGPV